MRIRCLRNSARVGLAALAVAAGLGAMATVAPAAVVLNEVNCEGTDWVELVNTASVEADLSGWLLTDDPLTKNKADHRLVLPAGTTLPAYGRRSFEKGAGGFPFGISCGDDTIRLAASATATTTVDDVVVPALPAGATTWGRVPDGTGAWRGTLASRDAPNVAAPDGAADPEEQLAAVLDPATVSGIDLQIPTESRAGLAVDPGTYQPATFTLTAGSAVHGPYAVGVRLKGHLSQRGLDGKAAFKVKFNFTVPGQRFLGLEALVLNNMVQDPSMVRELLAYTFARSLGIPAPRTGYAFVTVDGDPFGVYLSLEPVDAVLLARWYPTTGHLYEGEYGSDVVPGLDGLELDEGDDDRSDLADLVDRAAGGGLGWDERVAAVADLDEMTLMWAMERYMGHWDGYASDLNGPTSPNNYYLHSDGAGVFTLLPWGTDGTWWMSLAPAGGGGRLFAGCLTDPACQDRYRSAIEVVKARAGDLDLRGLAGDTAAMLRPWQILDPRRESTLDEADATLDVVRGFLVDRRSDPRWTDVELPPAPPEEPAPPGPPNPPKPPTPTTPTTPTTPKTPTTPTTPKPAPVPAPKVTVSAVKVSGATAVISTSVKVTTAGSLRQRTTARRGSSVVRVCLAEARIRQAGTLRTNCRMSSWARRFVKRRATSVSVSTTLTPAKGPSVNHVVTVRAGH